MLRSTWTSELDEREARRDHSSGCLVRWHNIVASYRRNGNHDKTNPSAAAEQIRRSYHMENNNVRLTLIDGPTLLVESAVFVC
jgi:hypothetical protein